MAMRNFKLEKYLKDGEKTYALRGEIEQLIDQLTAKEYDSICMIGIGGTWAEWYPVLEVAKKYTDFPIYLENAAELMIKDKKHLSDQTLFFTSSASGDTKEILDAVKLCKSNGWNVYGFTKDETTPLAELLTDPIYNACGDCEHSYLIYYFVMLRILKNRGEFPQYDRWADQMKNIFKVLVQVREQFEPQAVEIAKTYAHEPYTMFTGSGVLWGETYLFTMCILEEMQWVRTKAVTSADFFHGPLELVDDRVPVFVIMGEDEYRPLDERVERFVKKHTKKHIIIDTKDFPLEGIDDEFRVICSPMIITAILTERLAIHYELNTGHSLEFRRYYRQFAY